MAGKAAARVGCGRIRVAADVQKAGWERLVVVRELASQDDGAFGNHGCRSLGWYQLGLLEWVSQESRVQEGRRLT